MFSEKKLLALLAQYPEARFCVAYSGGLDSQALLYALSCILPSTRLRAIHVNHGWHADATQWAEICSQNCRQLGISFEVIVVNAQPKKGESPEACARQARYIAMARLIQAGDCLLTAHHQDDQAETVLLQLLRGTGLRGLAAMPWIMSFGKGMLLRPLLNFTRQELQVYAEERRLTWIEDSSNRNLRYNRNFIRHQVLPLLQQCWPGFNKTLARVAGNAAEAHQLLEMLAYEDWLKVREQSSNNVLVSRLLQLAPARRRSCLRYWLSQLCFPLPSQAQLHQIELMLESKIDANPQVSWGGIQIRRYRDFLYVLPRKEEYKLSIPISWDLADKLRLPTGDLLIVDRVIGQGIACGKVIGKPIKVSFRQGGEKFHLQGRRNSHPLKKFFQEWGIPPWQRKKIPLIYCEDELISVAGYGINASFLANSDEFGYLISVKKELYS